MHGDIKLSNVIIGRSGEVQIIDFGFSTIVESPQTKISIFSGTPMYLAPEIIRKIPFDGEIYKDLRPMCGHWESCIIEFWNTSFHLKSSELSTINGSIQIVKFQFLL